MPWIDLQSVTLAFPGHTHLQSNNEHAAVEIESLLLYLNCVVAVCVLCLFITVPWIALLSVVVAVPDHTHLLLFLRN